MGPTGKDFQVGDKVRVWITMPTVGIRDGFIEKILDPSDKFYKYGRYGISVKDVDGTYKIGYYTDGMVFAVTDHVEAPTGCTCGATKAKQPGHSAWCDTYQRRLG